jgi:hypothetical protein
MYSPSQNTIVLSILICAVFGYILIWATAKSLITAPQLVLLTPPIIFPIFLTLLPEFVTRIANILGIYSLVSVVTLFYSFYNLLLTAIVIVALNRIYKSFRLFVIEESVSKLL